MAFSLSLGCLALCVAAHAMTAHGGSLVPSSLHGADQPCVGGDALPSGGRLGSCLQALGRSERDPGRVLIERGLVGLVLLSDERERDVAAGDADLDPPGGELFPQL